MKILLLTDHYPPEIDVAGIRMFEFVRTFSKLDNQIKVVTYDPISRSKYIRYNEKQSENVEIIRYGRKYTPKIFYKLYAFNPLTLINWFIITIIEIFLYKPNMIVTTMPLHSPTISASFIARIFKIPHCIDIRDNWINPKMKEFLSNNSIYKHVIYTLYDIFYKLFILSCNNASMISVVYKIIENDIKKYTKFRGNVILVENGININELFKIEETFKKYDILKKHNIDKSNDEKYIIFVGSGSYYKPDILIDHIHYLRNKGHKFNYIIVGQNDITLKKGMDSYVYNIGKKSHKEVLELLLCCDMAFYALDKSFPLPDCALGVKVLEYISCKLPILSVAPKNSSVTEFITKKNLGIALDWDEQYLIEDSIVSIINQDLYKNNINEYYNEFINDYDRELNNTRLYNELKKLIDK